MAQWHKTLHIADIWNNDEIDIAEKGRLIAARIRRLYHTKFNFENEETYDPELEEIVEALANITGYDDGERFVEPVEEFNEWWYSFYEWANYERCWVETVERRGNVK